MNKPAASKTFLRAEWRKLAMANYAVDKSLLKKYIPRHTELDLWNDICYVSLIGFMFQDTRVKGMRVPFHASFEEVNLRFYIRYKHNSEWRRGVVFIKEIVPRKLLTIVANTLYNENYVTMPMGHSWVESIDSLTVEYKWQSDRWNNFKVVTEKKPALIQQGSEEEFITEHYWGYTKVSDQKTSEYGVEHPKWETYKAKNYLIDVDFGGIYGKEFDFLVLQKPNSIFLAEGSEVIVRKGRRLPVL